MYEEAKKAVDNEEGIGLGKMQICSVCGHTREVKSPDNCPICGADKGRFKEFS